MRSTSSRNIDDEHRATIRSTTSARRCPWMAGGRPGRRAPVPTGRRVHAHLPALRGAVLHVHGEQGVGELDPHAAQVLPRRRHVDGPVVHRREHPPVEPSGRVALQLVLVREVAVQRAHTDARHARRRRASTCRASSPSPRGPRRRRRSAPARRRGGWPTHPCGRRLRHVTNHDMLARVMSRARHGSGRSWDDGAVKWATAAAACSACESGVKRPPALRAGTSGRRTPAAAHRDARCHAP